MRLSFFVLAPLLAAPPSLPAAVPLWTHSAHQAAAKILPAKPPKYDPDEKLMREASLARGVAYLDNIAAFWMQEKPSPQGYRRKVLTSCGSCHANHAYLMARSLLPELPGSRIAETRRWMKQRLEKGFPLVAKSRSGSVTIFRDSLGFSELEFVAIAAGLAFHDARTTGELQPVTRLALSRMWKLQNPDGNWYPLDSCGAVGFPVVEFDRYYGATLAALATGMAPGGYANTDEARAGLSKLRRYFKRKPTPNIHHRSMLLWASLHVDGLMNSDERAATVKSLLALQRADGGWSTRTFSIKARHSQSRFGDPASDGYGTGFAVYILRQAGIPTDRPELVRGINWLKSHQRVSGRWSTAFFGGNEIPEGGIGTRGQAILNLGTAFCVMALKACEKQE